MLARLSENAKTASGHRARETRAKQLATDGGPCQVDTYSRMHNMNIDGTVMEGLMNWRSELIFFHFFPLALSLSNSFPPKNKESGGRARADKKVGWGGSFAHTQSRRARACCGEKKELPRLEAKVI